MNQGREDKAASVVMMNNIRLFRERELLSGIDWNVTRGEHWVVMGRNGAGKTLLLKIMAGYMWPSQGRVRVLDEPYGRVDLREVRKNIGWVSAALTAKIPPWEKTMDVVLSGPYATFGLYREPTEELREKADALLGDLGLSILANQKFELLSAGEKQRVILARSRLADPGLLILDEPCAGLDLAAREKLLALVQKFTEDPEGPTVIMVTHRVEEIVPGVSHALLLHRGKALGCGPIEDVLTGDSLSRTMEIDLRVIRENGRWQAVVA